MMFNKKVFLTPMTPPKKAGNSSMEEFQDQYDIVDFFIG